MTACQTMPYELGPCPRSSAHFTSILMHCREQKPDLIRYGNYDHLIYNLESHLGTLGEGDISCWVMGTRSVRQNMRGCQVTPPDMHRLMCCPALIGYISIFLSSYHVLTCQVRPGRLTAVIKYREFSNLSTSDFSHTPQEAGQHILEICVIQDTGPLLS